MSDDPSTRTEGRLIPMQAGYILHFPLMLHARNKGWRLTSHSTFESGIGCTYKVMISAADHLARMTNSKTHTEV